jgi:hypothetical protein
MKLTNALFLSLLFALPAIAQETDPPTANSAAETIDVPPPPPLPPKAIPPDDLAIPTVTIRREDGQIFEEYRVNGALTMIRVTPKKGLTYYLMDTTGDGDLETKWYENEGGIKPVYYKIFEWN